ncbi:MAG: hypothetical protein M1823_002465 [Watsoniomyces obsoletus]|nr:MAG: hypothetical protein M1823_002465 [Watsoniomyces obsoletus]
MSPSKLDQIVKGAVPPSATPSAPPSVSISEHDDETGRPGSPPDPLTILPSSPPQIYLNLLILEASLRAQYVTLRARRRQHTFFLFLLGAWITYFFYALFLRPREDGRGVGGSVYWMVETAEKVALMAGVVTAMLIWGTGQWERGIRWPRRWLGVANRGLRTINVKIVIIKGPWWRELFSPLAFLLPSWSLFSSSGSSNFHYVDRSMVTSTGDKKRYGPGQRPPRENNQDELMLSEEDLSGGGDMIKLLLLPKPFSPDFRENWELYRTEYWEKENERRAELRRQFRRDQRAIARQQGGWLWWTGWRGWKNFRMGGSSKTGMEGEKATSGRHHQSHHGHHHHHHHPQHHLVRQISERDLRHRRKGSSRSGSYSGQSSRSTTPTRETEDGLSRDQVRRRGSNASSAGGRPRKPRQGSSTSTTRPKRLTPDHRGSMSIERPELRRLSSRTDTFRTSSGIESD